MIITITIIIIHLLNPEALVQELDAAVGNYLGILGAGLEGDCEALDPVVLTN